MDDVQERCGHKTSGPFSGSARWVIYLPSATMGGLAIGNYSAMLANPELIETGSGSTKNGKVKEVVVSLADPSMVDRFMATLPSLAVCVSILLLMAYLMRSNYRLVVKGVQGEKSMHTTILFAGGVWLFLVAGSALLSGVASGYFNVKAVALGDFSSMVSPIFLILIDGLLAKLYWGREHGRATELDKKMQDVV